MRKLIGWILGSALMVLAMTAPGLPQAPSSTVKPNPLPVKVQVVVTRSEGDKKVSSPYSFSISSSGETSSLRIGTEVPVSTTGADGQTRFTLQQIGMQVDSSVTADGDGRFNLKLTLTGRFFYPAGQIRSFTSTNTFTLKDGESTKVAGSDDGGGAYTVDVALTVVK
jgi:hypothetical protein